MAVEEIKYTLPPDGPNSGSEVDIFLTYDPSHPAPGPGVYFKYEITGASGTYETIDPVTGALTTHDIDSVAPNGTLGADNLILLEGDQIVDGNGISFHVQGIAGDDQNGNVNFFYGGDVDGGEGYQELGSNTNDATNVTYGATACYCAGTLISTADGGVPVEALRIGDAVVTASGRLRPIKWIGTRSYAGRFAQANPGVLPICFHAGSLGDAIPARDLWVSPKHAMFLDDVLIPAEHLVNGKTVTKAERVESVTYFHVELDSHDVLLAEGAPSESFVDDDGRGVFHNARTFHTLYPDERRVEAVYCAPRVEDGYALQAVRRRLAERAGLSVPSAPSPGDLRGYVEGCDGEVVWGWAQGLAYPDAPVCLEVVVDGAVLGLVYADQDRRDLAEAGAGVCGHAFSFRLHEPLSSDVSHTMVVRRAADGLVLRGESRVAARGTVAA